MSERSVRVSVIIPCLDVEAVLPTQLEALAAQRCSAPWEVLVVDNGSTDRTREVAKSFRPRLPSLRIVEAQPKGRHQACNAGAAEAAGEYLVFVDGDDEVAPGFLEAMVRGLESSKLVGGRLDHRKLNPPDLVGVGEVQISRLVDGLGFLPFVMGANMGIRKTTFDELGGFENRPFCEDIDLSWRAQLAGVAPTFLTDAVVHYRQRKNERSMLRQHRRFGVAQALLFREFSSRGMKRQPSKVVLGEWASLARSRLFVRSRAERARWVRRFGRATGRLIGSLRYRVLFL